MIDADEKQANRTLEIGHEEQNKDHDALSYTLIRHGAKAKASAEYQRIREERALEEYANHIRAGGRLLAWGHDHGQNSRTASGQVVPPPSVADASPSPAPALVSALLPPAFVKRNPPLPPPPRHHEPRRPEAPPAVKCGAFWLHKGPGYYMDVQGGDETDEETAKARDMRTIVIRRRERE